MTMARTIAVRPCASRWLAASVIASAREYESTSTPKGQVAQQHQRSLAFAWCHCLGEAAQQTHYILAFAWRHRLGESSGLHKRIKVMDGQKVGAHGGEAGAYNGPQALSDDSAGHDGGYA